MHCSALEFTYIFCCNNEAQNRLLRQQYRRRIFFLFMTCVLHTRVFEQNPVLYSEMENVITVYSRTVEKYRTSTWKKGRRANTFAFVMLAEGSVVSNTY